MAAFNEAHPSPLNGRIPPSVVPEGKPGQTPDNSSSIYRQPYSQYTKQYTNIPFAFTPPFRPQAASEWPIMQSRPTSDLSGVTAAFTNSSQTAYGGAANYPMTDYQLGGHLDATSHQPIDSLVSVHDERHDDTYDY